MSAPTNPLRDALTGLVALDPDWFCGRWGGRRACESRNGDRALCHAPTCVTCHGCGDDLLPAGRYGSQGVTRVDRAYCSNACRQRSYRLRRKDA